MRKAIFAYYYAPGTGPGENPEPARFRPLPVVAVAPAKPPKERLPAPPAESGIVAPKTAEPVVDTMEPTPPAVEPEPTAGTAEDAPESTPPAMAEPAADVADATTIPTDDDDTLTSQVDTPPANHPPVTPELPAVSAARHADDDAEPQPDQDATAERHGAAATGSAHPEADAAPAEPEATKAEPIEADRIDDTDRVEAFEEAPFGSDDDEPASSAAPDTAPETQAVPAAPEAPSLHIPDTIDPEPEFPEPSTPDAPLPAAVASPDDTAIDIPPRPEIPVKLPQPLPAHLTMPSAAAIPHDVLGLFAPEVITIQARSGVGDSVVMGPPNAGMYRPDGFRPAPWSGLAYEMAPDDGRGMCAGTRLLTARGEVPVEQLLPSDRVLGLRGPKLARIATITRRALSAANKADAPLLIPAGALGGDQPSRDLLVGPDQVLFPDGAEPVLARALADQGITVRPAELAHAELFQVALVPYPGAEDGDVLLADGVFIASRSRDGAAT